MGRKMINKQTINDVKHKLVAAYDPLNIYLFGSFAWGTPHEESDLDLLIVVSKSSKNSYERAVKGYHALRKMTIPKDILVLTKREFDERSNDVTTLCYKAKHEGKLLYAKP
jgi:predicted nucleotidyltransferase